MRVIMVMYDSLNRNMLEPYGIRDTAGISTPGFRRLAEHSVVFDNCYAGSLPCMPARRELHTGRYNFLHRSWGPLEPFDDSMPEILNRCHIHSHLVTDHYHYFEDGGATYHTRYRTWEGFRGQEGDGWKGVVDENARLAGSLPCKNRCDGLDGSWLHNWVPQDLINRTYMKDEALQPQSRTFEAGKEFIRTNRGADQWFLQIETFDPHEPFFSQEKYQKRFPHPYDGPLYDWPDYRKLDERDAPEEIRHLRAEYKALLAMCDDKLGEVLDLMDEYDMWKDTMLIVNTDHGFLLGEHGQWAKCHCPFYNEVARLPLFIWNPLSEKRGIHVKSLVQTIDLPATILKQFGIALPDRMEGIPLQQVMEDDRPIREAALFGLFGGQINCADGRYVYMRSPVEEDQEICQYTLMPTRHSGRRAFINEEELKDMTLVQGGAYSKGLPIMRIPYRNLPAQAKYDTMLFDLEQDEGQNMLCHDKAAEKRMERLMRRRMQENGCPPELWIRYGLSPLDK